MRSVGPLTHETVEEESRHRLGVSFEGGYWVGGWKTGSNLRGSVLLFHYNTSPFLQTSVCRTWVQDGTCPTSNRSETWRDSR